MAKCPITVVDAKPVTKRCRGVEAAAKKVGTHPANLSLILHGRREPGKELAKRLKKAGIKWPMITNESEV